MKLSKSKIIGLIALLAVVGVVCGTLVWRQSQPAPAEPTEQVSITGYLGGEKIGLFDDAKFKALAAKQGIAIDYRKAGSPAMMDTDRKGMGYLFPSSRAAVEYGNAKGVKAPPITMFGRPRWSGPGRRFRYDFPALSSMIRGVLSPGTGTPDDR